jgi:hypothetical protein
MNLVAKVDAIKEAVVFLGFDSLVVAGVVEVFEKVVLLLLVR